MTGFAILVGEAIIGFYKKIHAINFGVYGATMVGKTPLGHQLRTRGEVAQIKERTVGVHRATRKRIKFEGEVHTLRSADIGGESIYWKEWIKDMQKRRVKYIIFMIDHRHLDNEVNLDHQVAWKFLVDTITSSKWPNGKRKRDSDYPMAVGIWANKFDLWKDTYPYDDIMKHPIFDIFQDGIQRLNDKGIPTYRYIVSAKSDSEMVYRGITTMIEDY